MKSSPTRRVTIKQEKVIHSFPVCQFPSTPNPLIFSYFDFPPKNNQRMKVRRNQPSSMPIKMEYCLTVACPNPDGNRILT